MTGEPPRRPPTTDHRPLDGVVEFVRDATAELVTSEQFASGIQGLKDRVDARFDAIAAQLRAEMYRVSLIQGGIIIGAVVALVKLL